MEKLLWLLAQSTFVRLFCSFVMLNCPVERIEIVARTSGIVDFDGALREWAQIAMAGIVELQ
jgi:hypothetical protein